MCSQSPLGGGGGGAKSKKKSSKSVWKTGKKAFPMLSTAKNASSSSSSSSYLVEQPRRRVIIATHRVDERARQSASSIVPIVRHAREIRRPLPGRDGRVARAVHVGVAIRFFFALSDRSRLHVCTNVQSLSLSRPLLLLFEREKILKFFFCPVKCLGF